MPPDARTRREVRFLLLSIFLVAECAITYELLVGALGSYLVGNSVAQFSVTIGIFLSAMGLGSWLSRFVRGDLLAFFVDVELVLAVVGGGLLFLLYAAYAWTRLYELAWVTGTALVGILVGLEIPVLTRLVKRYGSLRTVLADVLAFDYLGGLAASLLFPFVLLPYFGLLRTAFLTGLVNLAVAAAALWVFRGRIPAGRRAAAITLCGAALAAGFALALPVADLFEKALYDDPVLYSRQTPYQKLTITKKHQDLRLYIDGSLQFSTADEYRYHEPLVHPAVLAAARPRRALVLGGGDGMAVRELLRHASIERVVLVDLDRVITDLARDNMLLREANGDALRSPRVTVVVADAFKWLEAGGREPFDVVVADFPDPHAPALAKLYSREFYRLVRRVLAPGGTFVTQASSPFFSREAFWIVRETVAAVFGAATGYRSYVPSFGEWGFVLAGTGPARGGAADGAGGAGLDWSRLPAGLRHLTAAEWRAGIVFPPDSARPAVVPVNTLADPVVAAAYQRGWKKYN